MSIRGRPAENDGEFVIDAHASSIIMHRYLWGMSACMAINWHIAYKHGLVSCVGLALGTTATGSKKSG